MKVLVVGLPVDPLVVLPVIGHRATPGACRELGVAALKSKALGAAQSFGSGALRVLGQRVWNQFRILQCGDAVSMF
jgi:hypothetical protein